MDWKTRKEKLQVNGSASHAAEKPAGGRAFSPDAGEPANAPEAAGPDWGVPADLAKLAEASTSLDEADRIQARSVPPKATPSPVGQPVSLDAFAPYRPDSDTSAEPPPSQPNPAAFQFQSIGHFTPPADVDITEPSTIFSNHPKTPGKPVKQADPGLQSPFSTPMESEEPTHQFGSPKRDSVASGLVTNDDEFGIPRVAPFIVNMPTDAPEPVDDISTDRVLILKVRNLSATYPLVANVTTMGRPDKETQSYPDVEIELDDSVSRKHAEVRRKGKEFFLIDLGSTNGTLLNGQALRPGIEIRLQHGDRIRLGERTELVFE